jgi:hypothetical protein
MDHGSWFMVHGSWLGYGVSLSPGNYVSVYRLGLSIE